MRSDSDLPIYPLVVRSWPVLGQERGINHGRSDFGLAAYR